ncbi:DUF4097 family beta strand repeat-containing protein [Sporosarcina oncorhynchi]|uniref:DUF4097 family beta strand repeat-containing protein n=1 Tax=Sporosarcina oncorhynchi TaxID=3056444 RepID=A0ABZ0L2C4_9BACL|nr:DUF4097 family beta strand repeat-containing protein [Sporosarcina sp. T2O-4]WOV86671.1 DUF4097 family beta strand repeat-containing protein [Sporosarcina sp. T2O-4]
MTEEQFINTLEKALDRLPIAERTDILLDTCEYFANGRTDGKSDQEIAVSLGDPVQIAEDLLAAYSFMNNDVQQHPNNELITITNSHFKNVDINVQQGAIIISPTHDTTTTTVEVTGAHKKLALYAKIIEETLFIHLKSSWYWFVLLNFNFKPVTVNISLPKKVYQSFIMKSNNGRIEATKILGETISAKTINGRIELREIAATSLTAGTGNGLLALQNIQADQIHVKTANGRIEMNTIDAETIFTKSNNGRIELTGVNGALTGATMNGRITLQTTHLDQPIDFQTNNGSIQIEARNEPTNVSVQAKTANGKINIFGEQNSRTVFGNGEHVIRLRSGNGRITVKSI